MGYDANADTDYEVRLGLMANWWDTISRVAFGTMMDISILTVADCINTHFASANDQMCLPMTLEDWDCNSPAVSDTVGRRLGLLR